MKLETKISNYLFHRSGRVHFKLPTHHLCPQLYITHPSTILVQILNIRCLWCIEMLIWYLILQLAGMHWSQQAIKNGAQFKPQVLFIHIELIHFILWISFTIKCVSMSHFAICQFLQQSSMWSTLPSKNKISTKLPKVVRKYNIPIYINTFLYKHLLTNAFWW